MHYQTRDLNEAAFIWCQSGVTLDDILQIDNTDTYSFRFRVEMSDEALKDLLYKYSNQQTVVEPQLFVLRQSNLRDRLYTVKRKR
jgi:hypothetical protein